MSPVILRTATLFILPLLLLFSVFLLLRGHDEPGGGFVGGLMAAGAIALYAIACDVPSARRLLRVDPQVLTAAGLLLALVSGLVGLVLGDPLLTGKWTTLHVPLVGELHIGTPVLFDAGVYLAVIGVTLLVVLNLLEECPSPAEIVQEERAEEAQHEETR
jgi:multicomponent Na+:H+ antiporter subunit B